MPAEGVILSFVLGIPIVVTAAVTVLITSRLKT